MSSVITTVAGRAVPLRGSDIDTDRIIPARFLRCVVFDGLGEHVFEDDRRQLRSKGQTHPFDDARFAGATMLVAGANFGCGSSREHAPQAIARWGIRGIIAVSYAEIFFGNCVAMGLPCVQLAGADAEALQAAVEGQPELVLSIDLATQRVSAGAASYALSIPAGPRKQFLTGSWDALGELAAGLPATRVAAARLPYVAGFR